MNIYDCDQCGLCCEQLIIEADLIDAVREPRIAHLCVLMNGHGAIRLEDACFSIACGQTRPCPFGSRGPDGKHKCDIYATRPGVCVSFQAGSAKCQELRAAYGRVPLPPRPAVSLVDRIRAIGVDE